VLRLVFSAAVPGWIAQGSEGSEGRLELCSTCMVVCCPERRSRWLSTLFSIEVVELRKQEEGGRIFSHCEQKFDFDSWPGFNFILDINNLSISFKLIVYLESLVDFNHKYLDIVLI
jgi:hypothetical protein